MTIPKNPEVKMKMEATEKAKEYVDLMCRAKTDPTVKIDGEVLNIWQELESWGLFERYPIEKPENHWIYTTMLAMTKYRHLKWQAKNPVKKKLSKWEVVHGKANKKR